MTETILRWLFVDHEYEFDWNSNYKFVMLYHIITII